MVNAYYFSSLLSVKESGSGRAGIVKTFQKK